MHGEKVILNPEELDDHQMLQITEQGIEMKVIHIDPC